MNKKLKIEQFENNLEFLNKEQDRNKKCAHDK